MLVQVLAIALGWMNHEDDFKKTISPILEATLVAILLYDYDGMLLYSSQFILIITFTYNLNIQEEVMIRMISRGLNTCIIRRFSFYQVSERTENHHFCLSIMKPSSREIVFSLLIIGLSPAGSTVLQPRLRIRRNQILIQKLLLRESLL